MATTKRCGSCRKNKPLADFSRYSAGCKRHAGALRSSCRQCVRDYLLAYRARRKSALREQHLARNRTMRQRCLEAYGGAPPKCACCGEDTREFLALDHINGNGRKHRAAVGHGTQLYYWIVRHNFPPMFQVLCHNCNSARQFYGECPHRRAPLAP